MHATNLWGVTNMIYNRVKIQEAILECGSDELKQTKWSLVVINAKFSLYTKVNNLKYRREEKDLIALHVERISFYLIKSLHINDARRVTWLP